jgi:hypothetical protein
MACVGSVVGESWTGGGSVGATVGGITSSVGIGVWKPSGPMGVINGVKVAAGGRLVTPSGVPGGGWVGKTGWGSGFVAVALAIVGSTALPAD